MLRWIIFLFSCASVTGCGAVELLSISPAGTVDLGERVVIRYRVNHPVESVRLEVRNHRGQLIHRSDLLSALGEHETTWNTRWNQPPHPDAFANPLNGPYRVTFSAGNLIARRTLSTRLVLEAELNDGQPAPGEISSGLHADSVGLGDASRIASLAVMPTSGGATIDSTLAPVISNIRRADLDNDPDTGTEIHSADISVQMQSVPDGEYQVVVRHLRDRAGNDAGGPIIGWTIELR